MTATENKNNIDKWWFNFPKLFNVYVGTWYNKVKDESATDLNDAPTDGNSTISSDNQVAPENTTLPIKENFSFPDL